MNIPLSGLQVGVPAHKFGFDREWRDCSALSLSMALSPADCSSDRSVGNAFVLNGIMQIVAIPTCEVFIGVENCTAPATLRAFEPKPRATKFAAGLIQFDLLVPASQRIKRL